MPFSGSGSFAVYTPGNPAVTGTTISSTAFNNTMNDFATGLSNTITRDGQSPATANIPLGGFKLTGLAAATTNGDAVRYEQISGAVSTITSLTGLTSVVTEVRQIQPITAAIASNAITITPSALSLEFRNTTLTNGAVTFVEGTPAALVIAATDSFGLTTAYGNQRLAILAINNAGTIELAATALYGGNSLDETGVITTATSSTTAAGIKAAAVRTGVAYRVIGFVDATFTTAVGWGSLALVQGAGGNAATSLGSLGYGQTWQNVTGSRAGGTTYYNTTGRPIFAKVSATNGAGNAAVTPNVGGVGLNTTNINVSGSTAENSFIVPAGSSYSVSIVGTLTTWAELR